MHLGIGAWVQGSKVMSGIEEYLRIPRDSNSPGQMTPNTFYILGMAYYEAAEILWGKSPKNGHTLLSPDYLAIPLLFLLHHFVEVELKGVIELSQLLGDEGAEPVTPTHDLLKLLKSANLNLNVLGDEPCLDEASENLVVDLQKFGSNGVALRYPELKSRHSHMIVDLPQVMSGMKQIKFQFDGLISELMVRADYSNDQLVT